MYGVKQTSRQQYAALSHVLAQFGFDQNKVDYSFFTTKRRYLFTIVLVYVDGIIVTTNSISVANEVKELMDDKFKIKDLGNLKNFLGIEVAWGLTRIYLNQRKYALDIFTDADKLGSKPSKASMDQNMKTRKE